MLLGWVAKPLLARTLQGTVPWSWRNFSIDAILVEELGRLKWWVKPRFWQQKSESWNQTISSDQQWKKKKFYWLKVKSQNFLLYLSFQSIGSRKHDFIFTCCFLGIECRTVPEFTGEARHITFRAAIVIHQVSTLVTISFQAFVFVFGNLWHQFQARGWPRWEGKSTTQPTSWCSSLSIWDITGSKASYLSQCCKTWNQ